MSYHSINNAVGYCGQGTTITETQAEIKAYAKEKAKLAKQFLPRMTSEQKDDLMSELCSLKSTTEIDIYFRRYINNH